MNSYERIIKTFKGEKTDRVPIHHIGFSSQVASQLLGREAYIGGGIQQWREASSLWDGPEAHEEFLQRSLQDAFEISKMFDMDIVRAEYWRMNEKPNKKIDRYTYLYGSEESWCVRRFIPETELYDIVECHPPRNEETFYDIEKTLDRREEQLACYDPAAGNFKMIEEAIKMTGTEKALRVSAGQIEIPLGSIWMEAVCLAPELIKRHLELMSDKAIKDIKYLSGLGVKLIFGGGDLASNTGPIYSPKKFNELMLPVIKKITEACHEEGMYYLYASDGNLWPVATDLFGESGIDGYFEIDRRAGMGLDKLKDSYPKMTLIGNISSITLHKGQRSEVIEESLSCLKAAKKHVGMVVGCSNYFVSGTPLENIYAMTETLNKYR